MPDHRKGRLQRAIKYVGLFDGEREDRIRIESLDQIYDLTDRLRATARFYADGGTRKAEAPVAATDTEAA